MGPTDSGAASVIKVTLTEAGVVRSVRDRCHTEDADESDK